MKEEKRKHSSSYDSVLVNVLLATHSCRSIFDKKDYDVIPLEEWHCLYKNLQTLSSNDKFLDSLKFIIFHLNLNHV
jgi:hypothetical protein